MYKQVEPARPRPMSAAGPRYPWTLFVAAILVGIAAVMSNAPQYETRFLTINAPVIFGVLLWLSVSLQFYLSTLAAIDCSPATKIHLAQQLTRRIYLVCYLLAGARMIRYFAASPGTGVLLDESMKSLQPYLCYALPALISVKVASRAMR